MTSQDSNKPDPQFGAALRALAADDAKLSASPNVEKRILAEVRNISRLRRRRAWFGVGSAAAVLLLGITLNSWRIENRHPSDAALSPSASEGGISEVATDFLPLPYSHVPMNMGSTVRVEVPAAALVSFGLAPLEFRKPDGTIQADVLIGDDGLARAIRFVRPLRN